MLEMFTGHIIGQSRIDQDESLVDPKKRNVVINYHPPPHPKAWIWMMAWA